MRGSFSQFSDMYDLLEQVRLRPGMWVRGHSVRELETMLCGYSMALAVHDVPEYFELDPARPVRRLAPRNSPLGHG